MKIVLTKTLGDLMRKGQTYDLPNATILALEAQTGLPREQFLRLDSGLTETEEVIRDAPE